MKRRMRNWGLAMLMLAVLVGCQNVGGFDLNETVLKQLDVETQEQSGYVELAVDWNEEYADASADERIADMMKLLGKVRLDIQNARSDVSGRASVKGSVTLGNEANIPFALQFDGSKLRLDVEGAKLPFIMDVQEAGSAYIGGIGPSFGSAEQKAVRQLLQKVGAYWVRHLPNPPNIDVGRELTSVNGEYATMTKIHAELNGEQLGQLLIQYLDNVVQDEAGFRDMLDRVMQWIESAPPELTDLLLDGEPLPSADERKALLEEISNELFPLLKEAQAEIADASKNPEWRLAFDPGIALKTDLYVDDQFRLRKSDTEIVVAPAMFNLPTSPVSKVTIRVRNEMWNVNGNVSVPAVETPPKAYNPEEMESIPAVQFVRMFEENSAMYELLKNELQLDDVAFQMSSEWDYGIGPHFDRGDSEETLHVPLRHTVESFDDKVTYYPETGEVRIIEYATGQEIVLLPDSSEALVSGVAFPLSEPMHRHGSYLYMAAKDLFMLLGASYEYRLDDNGSVHVTVKRDL